MHPQKPYTVTPYHAFNIRGVDEIKFSHGGHLFALNDNENRVHVFKFF